MYENDYKNGLDGAPTSQTVTIWASKEKQRLLSIRNTEGHLRSQDSGVGRCGVRVSTQLGCLPGAGGRPQCPRRQEEPPSELVRCGGRRSGGQTGPAPLRGGWEWGGVPTPEGTLRGSDQGGAHSVFPLPNWAGSYTLRGPPWGLLVLWA